MNVADEKKKKRKKEQVLRNVVWLLQPVNFTLITPRMYALNLNLFDKNRETCKAEFALALTIKDF